MNQAAMPIAEVAEINPPQAKLSAEVEVAFIPMAAVSSGSSTATPIETRKFSELSGGLSYFQDGDILVAKITPCFENGKIAQVNMRQEHGFGSTEFHVVRANGKRLHARYLLHFLRQEWIREAGERRMTGSAGQRRVPKNFIEQLAIPLPFLSEQKRIAAILDKAEVLHTKRQLIAETFDVLEESLYLEIFNQQSIIPTISLEDVAKNIRTGPFGSQLLHSEFVDSGIAVLGIDNAVQNKFVWARPRFITVQKFTELRRYQVLPQDVLITIMGTCGRCAIVPDKIPTSINTKHLCCITLDQAKCLPQYLRACLLFDRSVQSQLGVRERGAVMPGLNMQLIKSLAIPVPPIEVQHRLTEQLSLLQRYEQTLRESAVLAQSLFSSLQRAAFVGEL